MWHTLNSWYPNQIPAFRLARLLSFFSSTLIHGVVARIEYRWVIIKAKHVLLTGPFIAMTLKYYSGTELFPASFETTHKTWFTALDCLNITEVALKKMAKWITRLTQWKTTLHCNVDSHWLIPYTRLSLSIIRSFKNKARQNCEYNRMYKRSYRRAYANTNVSLLNYRLTFDVHHKIYICRKQRYLVIS